MINRQKPIDVAIDHAHALPTFKTESAAKSFLDSMLREWHQYLVGIVTACGGPSVSDFSLQSLRDLEQWSLGLGDEQLAKSGTTSAELSFLIMWHAASVAAKCVPHVEWAIQESAFAAEHWEFGIRCGLLTQCLPVQPGDREPKRRRGKRVLEWTEMVEDLQQRPGTDRSLHALVLKNKHRMSADPSLSRCQMMMLSNNVDAFDEAALRSDLVAGTDVLLALRCFEAFDSLSGPTIEQLVRLSRGNELTRVFAVGLLLRHRPSRGLPLAAGMVAGVREYDLHPIIDGIAFHPNLPATSILADATEKITRRTHPLWQCRREFAIAVGILWKSARAGDVEARQALKVVGRRWKRIPPETLELIAHAAPGLTAKTARAGGLEKP